MLPTTRPIGLVEGLVFEVVRSLPVAVAVLGRRLGWALALRVLLGVAVRSLGRDPLKATETESGTPALLVRRQLRSILLLDASLREGLGLSAPESFEVLKEVVGTTGAAFIDWTMPMAGRDNWVAASAEERGRYVQQIISRFPNATATPGTTTDDTLAFEVTACRFASLTRQVGRPDLGPLFCHADAVYFGRPEAPVTLERSATLAQGDPSCPFQFRFRPDD